MNVVFIIVLIFLVLNILNGYRRGLIKSVVSTFAFFVAIILAVQLAPVMGKFLRTTPVYTAINNTIEKSVNERIDLSATKVSDQVDKINDLPLPQSLKDSLIENNNTQIYDALGINEFSSYISNYMTCLILNAVSQVLVFIIVYLIIRLIGYALNIISKVPVLNSINKIGGLLFGVVNGLIILWVGCVVITIFAWTSWAQYLFASINDSVLLSLIYNTNYLLDSVVNMGKLLF